MEIFGFTILGFGFSFAKYGPFEGTKWKLEIKYYNPFGHPHGFWTKYFYW